MKGSYPVECLSGDVGELPVTDSERLAVIEATVNDIRSRLFGADGTGGFERRLMSLETWRWWILGAGAALFASSGIVRIIADALLGKK
jgi:hypothetical protein